MLRIDRQTTTHYSTTEPCTPKRYGPPRAGGVVRGVVFPAVLDLPLHVIRARPQNARRNFLFRIIQSSPCHIQHVGSSCSEAHRVERPSERLVACLRHQIPGQSVGTSGRGVRLIDARGVGAVAAIDRTEVCPR